MKIWLDGGLQDIESARVSVFDHGLTVGDGIFETVKAVDGRPFALTRHLDRLTRSARGLGLPDPDLDEVRRACAAVLEANPMPLGRLRITYTGGHGPLGSDRGEHGPTLVVALGETARAPRLHGRDHGPLDPQRTRRADRPEDDLVRRERRRPRPRPRTGRLRGAVRQHRRAALRGHRLERLRRPRRRDSTPRRSPPAASRASRAHWRSSGPAPGRPTCRWTSWSAPTRSS